MYTGAWAHIGYYLNIELSLSSTDKILFSISPANSHDCNKVSEFVTAIWINEYFTCDEHWITNILREWTWQNNIGENQCVNEIMKSEHWRCNGINEIPREGSFCSLMHFTFYPLVNCAHTLYCLRASQVYMYAGEQCRHAKKCFTVSFIFLFYSKTKLINDRSSLWTFIL